MTLSPSLADLETDELLRMRAELSKYSEDQPRDEHGRWSAGGSAETHAARAWQDAGSMDAIRNSIVAGKPNSEARTLLRMYEQAPRSETPLYRGVAYTAEAAQQMTVGHEFALPISSFSSDSEVGNGYMSEAVLDRPGTVGLLLELEPGAKALDLHGYQDEAASEGERVAMGTFVVTRVRPNPEWTGSSVVTVRQTATKAEKYSDEEPRDELGRWTGGGSPFNNRDTVRIRTGMHAGRTGHVVDRTDARGKHDPKGEYHVVVVPGGHAEHGALVHHSQLEPADETTRWRLSHLPTAALLAARTWLRKYSADQPRGADGKWTADGVSAEEVHGFLSKYYPENTLGWVKDGKWSYERVPLNKIDMARRPGGRDDAKVRGIAARLQLGNRLKPVVLVETAQGRYRIADGYHRTLGARHAGRDSVSAYVGRGLPSHGPWDVQMQDAKENLSWSWHPVVKFDESEARDEAGRWTSDGAGALPPISSDSKDLYSPGYDPNARWGTKLSEDDALYWVASTQERRDAIRANVGVPGTVGNLMLKSMVEATPTTEPLYRGARLSKEAGTGDGRSVTDFIPGAVVNLNLTSFSESKDTGLLYARSETVTQGEDNDRAWSGGATQSTLIRLEPGASTCVVGDKALTEHLTAGQFLVTGSRVEQQRVQLDEYSPIYSGLVRVVDVKQVALIDPQFPDERIRKFDDSEPRDEQGRWTSGGDGHAVIGNPDARAAFGLPEPGDLTGDPERRKIGEAITAATDGKVTFSQTFFMPSASGNYINANALRQTGDALEQLHARFPQVPVKLTLGPIGGTAQAATETMLPGSGLSGTKVILNSNLYRGADTQALYGGDRYGTWHPAGTGNPEGIITHEYGHVVQDYLERAGRGAPLRAFVSGLNPVSAYARTDNWERFAEAFSGAYAPFSAVKDSATSKSVRSFLDRYLPASAQKYSDDQPRDEHGRWTSGGSSPSNDPAGHWRDPQAAHPEAWKQITRQIKRQGSGNCYQAADTLMLNADRLGLENPVVVQATAVGRGPIEGQDFGHSWLEADGPQGLRLAYDFSSGNTTVLPADYYRYLGRVKDAKEFGPKEAFLKMGSTRHYGPWDTAEKYAPEEARDEQGRWTAGGGERMFAQPRRVPVSDVTPEFVAAVNWQDGTYRDWWHSLTVPQEDAVHLYQSFHYQVMNGLLRGQVPEVIQPREGWGIKPAPVTPRDIEEARQGVKEMAMAIERAPALDQPTVVFRQMSGEAFAGLKAGDTFTDRGFVSTSLLRPLAQAPITIKDPVDVTIHLPSGTRAGAGNRAELVLQAGSSFRVNEVAGGRMDVTLLPGTGLPDFALGDHYRSLGKAAQVQNDGRYLWSAGDIVVG